MSDSLRPPWHYEDPLCAEVGTEIFFAKDLDEVRDIMIPQETYKEARKICQQCDHVQECAEWGIKYESHGVWGGLTPSQRTKLKRSIIKVPFRVKR